MQEPVAVLSASSSAVAVLQPVRSRLLRAFREPASAAEAARSLDLPRQRVGHHVRRLVSEGLLEHVGERRRGNFVEQLLQAKARAYVVAPVALGELGAEPDRIRDRFSSAYLLARAGQTIRDVGVLQELAGDQHKKLATLTIDGEVRFRSAQEQQTFAQELTGMFAELVRRYHDEEAKDGRRFSFTMSGYPTVARKDDPNPT